MSVPILLTLSVGLLALPVLMRFTDVERPEVRGGLRLLWWLNAAYCAALHRLRTESAPLPEHGPAILIANHTCGIDNFLLQAGCRRVLGFLILDVFYNHWLCRPFCILLKCIPVKRDGRDLAATRAALRALESGRVVPMFPEGRIHPTSGREIRAGKPGVAFLAMKSRVPVVPAYIRGTPETANVWEALATPSDARVLYGPPIDLSDVPNDPDRETLAAVTERLMAAIHALRERSLREERSEI